MMLPAIFDTTQTGLRMLLATEEAVENQETGTKSMPEWLARTMEIEVLPLLEIRIHCFLAEGYMRLGDLTAAQEHLEKIMELADAEDDNSKWARLTKMEIRLNGVS